MDNIKLNEPNTRGPDSIDPGKDDIVRALSQAHFLVPLIIFIIICFVNAWIMAGYLTPPLSRTWDELAQNYDAVLPEIVIENGVATVDGEQPVKINTDKKGASAIIIDTREGHEKDAMDYLSDFNEVIILTRKKVFFKTSSGRIQMFQIKDAPDMIINSQSIQEAKSEYFGLIKSVCYALGLVYSFFSKLITVLLFSLIPLLASKRLSFSLSYGQAVKLSIFLLVPVVAMDVALTFVQAPLTLATILHFALYGGLLLISVVKLIRSAPYVSQETPHT